MIIAPPWQTSSSPRDASPLRIVVAWPATTIAATCAATPATAVTRVTFDPAENLSISLAGSTSPLYAITTDQGTSRSTETIQKCRQPGKYGGCSGGWYDIVRTTSTQYENVDFKSLSDTAWIGRSDPIGIMPTADEYFTTNTSSIYWFHQTMRSDSQYTGIPTTPIAETDSPLVDKFLHLKFAVGDKTYVGLAKFAGRNLDYVDYEALPGASAAAVPEPESWAMLIAGLGLTGAAMRRSRQRRGDVETAS